MEHDSASEKIGTVKSWWHRAPRWLKVISVSIGGLIGLFVLGVAIYISVQYVSYLGSAQDLSSTRSVNTASFSGSSEMETAAPQASVSDRVNRSPRTQNYSDLEAYETTDYRVQGEIRPLDALCTELEQLKDDSAIDFRRLQITSNRCVAEFFVAAEDVGRVRDRVTNYPVALTRTTESVSAYRSDLFSQSEIVRQQLREVETLLAEANERYDTLARFAQEQGDAQALTQTVDDQLDTLDRLTQRRISLTERLQQLEQSKANLQDRINRVRFSVNVSRLIPQQPNEDTARWAVAWDDLTDRLTAVQIGLTAYFAIFILYTLQYAFYGVVAIIVLRLLWKFIRFVWRY